MLQNNRLGRLAPYHIVLLFYLLKGFGPYHLILQLIVVLVGVDARTQRQPEALSIFCLSAQLVAQLFASFKIKQNVLWPERRSFFVLLF